MIVMGVEENATHVCFLKSVLALRSKTRHYTTENSLPLLIPRGCLHGWRRELELLIYLRAKRYPTNPRWD